MKCVLYMILVVAIAAGAALAQAEAGAGGEEKEAPKSRPVLKVKQALEDPEKYFGSEIVVVGMFLGYNGKCPRPLLFRGEAWMLQDEENTCIYVAGDPPEGFSAQKKIGIGVDIAAPGFLRKTGDLYYLQSTFGQGEMAEKREEAKEILEDIARRQVLSKTLILTVSDIFNNSGMIEDTVFVAKGIYREDGDCKYPAPGNKKKLWALEDLAGSCIYVEGPPPAQTGKQAEDGALVSFRAMTSELKNKDEKDILFLKLIPEQKKEAEHKNEPGKETEAGGEKHPLQEPGPGDVIDFEKESGGDSGPDE